MAIAAQFPQRTQAKTPEVDRDTLQRQIEILKELKASEVLVKKAEALLRTL